MKHRILAFTAFFVALSAGIRAVLLQFITLATNDAHDYQPIMKSSLLWAVFALASSGAYIAVASRNWRFAAAIPLLLGIFALWGEVRMWPYVFG